MTQSIKPKHDELSHSDSQFLGITLAVIGLLMLLFNVVRSDILGYLVLPTIGVLFLAWGVYRRRFGLTIPGCILTGLGVAVFATQAVPDLGEEAEGGVFVLALALSFGAMTLISPYFRQKVAWWPLVPGTILGIVGALLLIGTTDALHLLEILGSGWPLGLIVVGLYFLIVPRTRRDE